MASASATEYTNSLSGDGELLGVLVYSSVGSLTNPVAALYPNFQGGRPVEFPPSIDIFLWGGLSAYISEPVWKAKAKIESTYLLLFLLASVILISPLLVSSAYAETMIPFPIFLISVFGIVILIGRMFKSRYLGAMHGGVRSAVEIVAPHFQQAGFDINYHVEESMLISSISYVTLRPTHQYAHVDNVDLPPTTPLLSPNASIRLYTRKTWKTAPHYDLRTATYPKELTLQLGRFDWGAISESIKPLMDKHIRRRKMVTRVLLLTFLIVQPIAARIELIESVFGDELGIITIVLLFAILVGLQIYEGCIGQKMLNPECESVIAELKPKIYERTGFEMEYVVEPGFGCGSWSSYVHLYPDGSKLSDPMSRLV